MAVLLTGFEGYRGRSLDPTEEVAGETVESRLLPVDYRELRPRIEAGWIPGRSATG
jgi:pyrrolidone-carboxylate peptidase